IAHGNAAKLAFTTQPPGSVQAGGGFGSVVTIEDAAGNVVTGNSSSVTIAITGGGTTLGGTTAVAVANGVATFSANAVPLAGGYTLTATGAALTSANSDAFAVNAGAAAKLAFLQQPGNIVVGALQPVTVAIEDTYGNIETAVSNAT